MLQTCPFSIMRASRAGAAGFLSKIVLPTHPYSPNKSYLAHLARWVIHMLAQWISPQSSDEIKDQGAWGRFRSLIQYYAPRSGTPFTALVEIQKEQRWFPDE